jgi:hypothetical protein
MALTQLARSRWQDFFDAASRAAGAQQATVEVTGLQLGDQIAADHAVLTGITYEPKDDTLTVILEGLEHRIRQPTAIHVDMDVGALRSIEAVDAEGVHHIVQFSAALELPAP